MADEIESGKKVAGGAGITAGGNVSIGEVTGQFAIGEYITQIKVEEPYSEAKWGNIKEIREVSTYKVACSDPQMIEISLFEVQSFLITENIAKVILLFGTLFIGGVISAYFSNISPSPVITIVSLIVFIIGLISDTYLIYIKFKELKQKGAKKWK